jgi:hypothetical protein
MGIIFTRGHEYYIISGHKVRIKVWLTTEFRKIITEAKFVTILTRRLVQTMYKLLAIIGKTLEVASQITQ